MLLGVRRIIGWGRIRIGRRRGIEWLRIMSRIWIRIGRIGRCIGRTRIFVGLRRTIGLHRFRIRLGTKGIG